MGDILTLGWTVRAEPVDGPVARALLRDYYTEIVGRYHHRPTDDAEIDQVLADEPSDDLTPPTGLFLVGWYDGEPAGCAGVRLGDLPYAEVTRVFVRAGARRRGGGARLLAAVEEAAAAYGATTMRLAAPARPGGGPGAVRQARLPGGAGLRGLAVRRPLVREAARLTSRGRG
ncbi:GNAT family N-acetyltransferase [Plantactinospora sp. CA-294935]|uniref:GNAT family N-acetyltransferase n=1 Tax=Plantactinospora sp. CA-294935 TaxID=3240012 RepID=UPI003D8A09D9